MKKLSPSTLWRLRTILRRRFWILALQRRHGQSGGLDKLRRKLSVKLTQRTHCWIQVSRKMRTIGDHVATLVSFIPRPVSVYFVKEEHMQIAIFTKLLMAVITLKNIRMEDDGTWKYVSTVFIGEWEPFRYTTYAGRASERFYWMNLEFTRKGGSEGKRFDSKKRTSQVKMLQLR